MVSLLALRRPWILASPLAIATLAFIGITDTIVGAVPLSMHGAPLPVQCTMEISNYIVVLESGTVTKGTKGNDHIVGGPDVNEIQGGSDLPPFSVPLRVRGLGPLFP